MNTITTTRKQRERQLRRTHILDTAETLFQKIGYEKTTIDDIAHDTELAKGTIYLYFSSKEEIVIGLLDRGLQQIVARFNTIDEESTTGFLAYQKMCETFIEFFRKHPTYPKNFSLYHALHASIESSNENCSQTKQAIVEYKIKLVAVMAKSLQSGIVDGSVRSDVDPVKTAMVTAMTAASFIHPQGMLAHSKNSDCKTDPYELLQHLFQLLGRAIKA